MARHDCLASREQISAFLDGDLSPRERMELRTHLASCRECAQLLESYRTVGDRIRKLTPVHAPEYLTDAIFAETIDAEPRRLFLVTSRIGYSMAAVAAVALIFIVSGYLILGGYQRGIQPAIAASAPSVEQESPWPLQNPIAITFNKSMNRASVESALAIQPAGEDDRLGRQWDGNTLVIGGNETLRPDTTYLIKITNDARDAWGNRLEPTFQLSFTTASAVAVFQTPTPEVPPTIAATPSETISEPTPSVSAERPSGRVTATPATSLIPPPGNAPSTVPTGQSTATTTTPSQDSTPVPVPPTQPVATATAPTAPTATSSDEPEDVSPSTPTSAPSTPTPSPTATIVPSATPTATAPATATSIPSTATPTTPPTATATPTQDTIPVTGAIGNVYWGNSAVRDRLGKPLAVSFTTAGEVQGFQRGNMLYRADSDTIYILTTSGLWTNVLNDATYYPDAQEQPDGGLWEPGGRFGYHWQNHSFIADDLGYATSPNATSFTAVVQIFERGTVIVGVDSMYVLYTDETSSWEFYPVVE